MKDKPVTPISESEGSCRAEKNLMRSDSKVGVQRSSITNDHR
jgi:hypothetical protein